MAEDQGQSHPVQVPDLSLGHEGYLHAAGQQVPAREALDNWVEPNKLRKCLIGNRRTTNLLQLSSDFDLPFLAALLTLNFAHAKTW